jgi:signal transduction histidine kinase
LLDTPLLWAQTDDHLEVQPQHAYTIADFAPYLYYIEDPDHSIVVEDCCNNDTVDWQKRPPGNIDFGFSSSTFWLKLPIKNISDKEGHWVLDLNSRFMNGLEAYLISADQIEPIVLDSEAKPFSERIIQYRQLAGEFYLAAGAKASIVIGYWSRGTTVLPFAIETEKTFYQQWIADNIIIVAFYSAILFMILFGLAQFIVLKKPVQLTYALYVAAGGLYVFHMDGLSFQYFWPNWPTWNADVSLLIGLNIGVFSVIFSRTFLDTARVMPRMDKCLLAILILTLALMLATFVIDLRGIKQYAFVITTATILLCMVAGIYAYIQGQKEARFYVLGWMGIFLSAGFATVSHLIEKVLPIPLTFDFAKVGIFIDGIMFAMAMADQANEVRKQRDLAHERERILLEQDLKAQKQMNRLEKQYHNALSLAQQKSHALASAGHDLRQPIFALKSAMNRVTAREGTDAVTINQFQQGFDYIERLIKEYLEHPDELSQAYHEEVGADEPLNTDSEPQQDNEEIFTIDIILGNLRTMFQEAADEKSIVLSCRKCTASVKANPVVVMRLLSNLTENALKYTECGKVVVGCRRRQGHLDVQVLDTGPGFSAQEQEKYFNAYQRGDNTDVEGLGLGLAIVRQLAIDHAYKLKLHSCKGKGSVFQISIPFANSIQS